MRHLCIYVYGCISCAIVLHIADVCLPYDQLHLAIVRLMMVKKNPHWLGCKGFCLNSGKSATPGRIKYCLEKRFQLRAIWLNLNLLESVKLCLTPAHVAPQISRPDWHLEVFRPATCFPAHFPPRAQTEPWSVRDNLSPPRVSAGHVIRPSTRIRPTPRARPNEDLCLRCYPLIKVTGGLSWRR